MEAEATDPKNHNPNNIETREVESSVAFPLTEAELMEKGRNVAQLYAQARTLEDALKAYSKGEKAKIEEIEIEIAAQLKCISTGKEERVMNVIEERDFGQSTVKLFYLGDKLQERTMDPAERQMGFELVKAEPKAIAPGDDLDENGMTKQTVFELFPQAGQPGDIPIMPSQERDPADTAPIRQLGTIEGIAPSASAPLPAGVQAQVIDDGDYKRVFMTTNVETAADKARDAAIGAE